MSNVLREVAAMKLRDAREVFQKAVNEQRCLTESEVNICGEAEEAGKAAQEAAYLVPVVPVEQMEPATVTNIAVLPQPPKADVNEQITQEVALQMREQTAVALQEESLQGKMKKAATVIVEKKVDTVVKKVTAENNEASSDLEEEALACFGYSPGKSIRKWQTGWAGGYHGVLSAIWMFLAMFTFAPAVFIAMKVTKAVKVTWWGVVLGLIVYAAVIAVPLLAVL